MGWTLAGGSVAPSGDRYEIRWDAGYFAVSVNGRRPLAFHRAEAAALGWVVRREAEAMRRLGGAAWPDRFTFASDTGERQELELPFRAWSRAS